MTTFQAHAPSSATAATPAPEREAGGDNARLMAAAQAAASALREIQRDIALHEDWAGDLQQAAGGMTGEARTTQEALVAALAGRLETLRGRRARLEADLGRLQRPDLARAGDRAAMEAFARLVETYAAAAPELAEQGFDLAPRRASREADMPRYRRLPPLAQAEDFGRGRGRRARLSGRTILRVAALVGFVALVLFAFGSERNEMAEPGEEARFMASNGDSRLPQITAAPGGGAFPGIRLPLTGLPLPGMRQSAAPGAAPTLPELSLPGGIHLDRLPEILPQAFSAARKAL